MNGLKEETNVGSQSGYASIHSLEMYYEIHGAANSARPPLVLLHGGGDTIQTSFGHVLPMLARDRQIVAFEQQGFGHTADIAELPFSFEQSADDTAALLEYLHIGQADLFGPRHRRADTRDRRRRGCHAPRTRRRDLPAPTECATCRASRHRSHGGDEADYVAGADGDRISGRRYAECWLRVSAGLLLTAPA